MTQAEEAGRGRPGTAVALVVAALLFPVLNWLPLFAAALAVLLVLLPPRRPLAATAGALGLAAVGMGLRTPELLDSATLAWSLVVAVAFGAATLLRPGWGFFARALAAVAAGLAGVGGWLAASGSWARVDAGVHGWLRAAVDTWLTGLRAQSGTSSMLGMFEPVLRATGELWWTVFPAIVCIQSLVALALAWWLFARFAPHGGRWAQLRPLREFRFNDHLIWVAIAGLVLVLLPHGLGLSRIGGNALFLMGGLYIVRGLGVLLFTTGVTPVVLSVVLGIFAFLPISQLVLAVALLVGLGDTWLDVRRRAALTPRA